MIETDEDLAQIAERFAKLLRDKSGYGAMAYVAAVKRVGQELHNALCGVDLARCDDYRPGLA